VVWRLLASEGGPVNNKLTINTFAFNPLVVGQDQTQVNDRVRPEADIQGRLIAVWVWYGSPPSDPDACALSRQPRRFE